MTDLLRVTITKTADGKGEFIRIQSDDHETINMVSVARMIEVKDNRPTPEEGK